MELAAQGRDFMNDPDCQPEIEGIIPDIEAWGNDLFLQAMDKIKALEMRIAVLDAGDKREADDG